LLAPRRHVRRFVSRALDGGHDLLVLEHRPPALSVVAIGVELVAGIAPARPFAIYLLLVCVSLGV
jgi:hypothetical protein